MKQHTYTFKDKKEDPTVIVRWCRRNFGPRGHGWDFMLCGGKIVIQFSDTKFETMYLLWHT